jgi:alpha-L-rhamnosidase
LLPEHVTRQAAYLTAWDDDAAAFESSDEMLNRIWELCRDSIKATTFAGVYVDGDRERIPYEADAYLNQLSHYYTDDDIQIARDTYDHLMSHPTWPTEWASHMIFMAYADWMHTGDVAWLAPRFEALKSKLLLERIGTDGLILSDKSMQRRGDLVDWPPKERDGFVFTSVNSVVNAFQIKSQWMMAEMAVALGKKDEASNLRHAAIEGDHTYQSRFFNAQSGLYVDGLDTEHSSLHANLFPLAFGLVTEGKRDSITDWLVGRGMQCSVYAAQYLMEALFQNGADTEAVELMTAPTDRSWRHMVEAGATITWEAWDMKYKKNQDWNHAWGAAPANLLPRFILGAEALEAGWQTARIRPCTAGLQFAKGKVPTPKGPIFIHWEQDTFFQLSIDLPEGMQAKLELPAPVGSTGVYDQSHLLPAKRIGDRWVVEQMLSGQMNVAVK